MAGCTCGKKIFERHNIPYRQYIMTNFGVEKGKTPITGDLIEEVVKKIEEDINK